MSNFDAIDLSKLPPPQVVEKLDFETVFQRYLAEFLARDGSYTELLETDPAIILLQVMAYRETLVRARINDAAKSNLLAYATGSDLDHLVADLGIERLEGETDERLRTRRQLALKGFSTAGPAAGYEFFSLSASALVKSVKVQSPAPGKVLVTILSSEGNGAASEELLEAVRKSLLDDDVRPLTDHVTVESAKIIQYEVSVRITLTPSPLQSAVLELATAKVREYIASRQVIGCAVAISGIYQALHLDGVERVELLSPKTDILPTNRQAAYCTAIKIKTSSEDEEE